MAKHDHWHFPTCDVCGELNMDHTSTQRAKCDAERERRRKS